MITVDQIKQFRERTGVGMIECKKALEEANGNEDLAIEILRKRGIAKAASKQTRTTSEGWIGSYVHANGKIGAMVVLACETDFVSRNEEFRALAASLAMHVAASSPDFVRPEEIPADIIAREKDVYTEQLRQEGKPEAAWGKIIEGKLNKFYENTCLLNQLYIKDDKKTISQLITEAIQKIGENIEIKSFTRLSL